MIFRWASLSAVLAALVLCGCGNYSNEDLDFQLALPDQGDMEAKMQLSVTRADSAEYYRATRSAVATFNGMVEKLTAPIEVVRGIVPTSRNGSLRIWGPWPADEQPGWEIRVVMQRSTVSATELHMDYSVQVRPQQAGDEAWVAFLAGWYESTGSAGTGRGDIHLLVQDARGSGFPVDRDPGLAELVRADVAYDRGSDPVRVSLSIEKLATDATKFGVLVYEENQDGSGQLTFDWMATSETSIAARMASRWIGYGAGRADLTADLTPNRTGVETLVGIDCWGVDSVATYRWRYGDKLADQSMCLFQ